MKTIATHLNMSVTTVSRALGNGERISAETIRRVRAAAAQLGYVRNLDGVKLRTGRSLVIFALLASVPEEEVGDAGSIGLLYGIHQRFVGTDYSVRAVPVEVGGDAMPILVEIVKGRLADGIILDHTDVNDERVRYLQAAGVPFVTFGRTEGLAPHPFLDIDNEDTAYQCTDALLTQGHQRVGMIEPDWRYTFTRQRLAGYQRALAKHGHLFDDQLVRRIDLNAETARRTVTALIRDGAIDGVVCVNEIVLLGVLAGVRDVGIPIGPRFGVAARAGTNLAAYLPVPLTISFYSRMEAGRRLADLLLRSIEGEPLANLQCVERADLRLLAGL